jgi:hypothetical protein
MARFCLFGIPVCKVLEARQWSRSEIKSLAERFVHNLATLIIQASAASNELVIKRGDLVGAPLSFIATA